MWLPESGLAVSEETEMRMRLSAALNALPAICYKTSGISPDCPRFVSLSGTLTSPQKICLPSKVYTQQCWVSLIRSLCDLSFLECKMRSLHQSSLMESRMEGEKGRFIELDASQLTSPSPFTKPHYKIAGTFRLEHRDIPCVSNNKHFLIMKFPILITCQGIVLDASKI